MSLQLKDLKEASYNPRTISDKRLGNLSKSMTTYGDLSGVVFNKRTDTLISGHQRLKTLRMNGSKTKIVTKRATDNFGTVAEGHIIAKTEAGELRIPIRVVDWSDKRAEKAANIAANAHGGDFDRQKLGTLLRELEKGKSFDIQTLGIDALSLRGLMANADELGTTGGSTGGDSFPEYDEDSFDLQHTCPKCKFQFNPSASSKAGGKEKPNKRVEASNATRKAKKEAAEKEAKKSKKSKGSVAEDAPKKKKKVEKVPVKKLKDKASAKLKKKKAK